MSHAGSQVLSRTDANNLYLVESVENNQYLGCEKQRALFGGVLRIAILETQFWVKPKECAGEEKESGAPKAKRPRGP